MDTVIGVMIFHTVVLKLLCAYIGPPVFLESPKNLIVHVGHPAMLHCLVQANPNDGGIQWQWGNNGDLLIDISTSDKYEIFTNGTLIIKGTVDGDTGEYQCTGSNSKGQITAKANLTVISEFTMYNRV